MKESWFILPDAGGAKWPPNLFDEIRSGLLNPWSNHLFRISNVDTSSLNCLVAPNVGKSSIFNWLVGRRLAIVDNMAGVTRDRMIHLLQENDRYFELVDTGGIGINDVDELDEEIETQIEIGIQGADVLMFVVDAKDGVTPLDKKVAKRLRGLDKPVLLVSNKCDGENWEVHSNDFFALGLGAAIPVSAKNNRRKANLMEAVLESLPESFDVTADETSLPEMKVAIVGRRNVGKSTFINTLVESERMIVSEVAGTTRDSVDVRFELDGKTMLAIDTPGLRRGKSVKTDIDFYGTHRAHRSIRHADVVLMMFDSSKRISKVDRQLVGYIENLYKPLMFVVNKWDLMAAHDMPTQRWADYLRDNFTTLWNAPIAFVTGQSGQNCKRMLNHAQMLFKQSHSRIATPELNKIIKNALIHHPPPMNQGRRPKIYYAAQIGVQPPTIMLKCNDPKCFSRTYQRYLLGVLRDTLDFGEVPIRLVLEKRSSTDPNQVLNDPVVGSKSDKR